MSVSAPIDAPNVTPCRSPAASGASARVPPLPVKNAPLSPIALWKSPRASGEAIRALTANDPADSPKIVTLPGVAAERGDVRLHPLQRRHLVQHPLVAGRVPARLARQLRVREEAEDAEPVVDGHEHDAPAGERLTVVPRFRAGSCLEAAAVDSTR